MWELRRFVLVPGSELWVNCLPRTSWSYLRLPLALGGWSGGRFNNLLKFNKFHFIEFIYLFIRDKINSVSLTHVLLAETAIT